jgi:hypothetical protein
VDWQKVSDTTSMRHLDNGNREFRITRSAQYANDDSIIVPGWQTIAGGFECRISQLRIQIASNFMTDMRFIQNSKWILLKPKVIMAFHQHTYATMTTVQLQHVSTQLFSPTALDVVLTPTIQMRFLAGRESVRAFLRIPNPGTFWNQLHNGEEVYGFGLVFEVTSNVEEIEAFNPTKRYARFRPWQFGQLTLRPWQLVQPNTAGEPPFMLAMPRVNGSLYLAWALDGSYFKIAQDAQQVLIVDPTITLYSDPADGYIIRERIGVAPVTYRGYTHPCSVGYWVWSKGIDPDPPVPGYP